MTRKEELIKTAKDTMKSAPITLLVETFELSSENEMTTENITVRGWILDELEARNENSFINWMEANTDSPREFYL